MKEADRSLRRIESRESRPLHRSQATIVCLDALLRRLRSFTAGYTFPDEQHEIHFFKTLKPALRAMLMYHISLYRMEITLPASGREARIGHLKLAAAAIRDFYELNDAFCQYYRAGATYLDRRYFLRGAEYPVTERIVAGLDHDPAFSTGYDKLVAQIIANDKMQEWIESEYRRLEKAGDTEDAVPVSEWVYNKIDLTELLYAFHSLQSRGGDKITLLDMSDGLRCWLGVDMANYSRMFADICRRDNPALFLDRLREALIKRVDDTLNKDLL